MFSSNNKNKKDGEFMAGETIPTPDQAEQALFMVKWWKEFLLGFGALLGIFATVKKGQKVPLMIPITEKELSNRMEICRHELKDEVHDDIRQIMHEHKKELSKEFDNMLEKIELMIEVATK